VEPVIPEKTPAEWEAYFREILLTEFSGYSIREKVPVTDLAGFANDEFKLYKTRPTQAYKAEWGQPYSFVLESGGSAKGVVMLGNGHSHDSNVKYLIARMYAKKLGIPYINFYTQMPNDRNYVIGRIRKLMG
jgi:L-rhamnose isomerase